MLLITLPRQLRKWHDKRRRRKTPLSACQLRRAKALVQDARLLNAKESLAVQFASEGVSHRPQKKGS
jgi:hypothetical protein